MGEVEASFWKPPTNYIAFERETQAHYKYPKKILKILKFPKILRGRKKISKIFFEKIRIFGTL